LTTEEIKGYKINLADCILWNEEEQKELTNQFRFCYEKGNPTVDETSLFWKGLFSKVVDEEVSDDNLKKLNTLFIGSTDKLAYLFSQKHGIGSMVNALRTVTHGCAANIAVHVTNAVYSLLFKSEEPTSDSIMFSLFANKIVPTIINSYKKDILGLCQDYMQNTIIRSNYVSPNKLMDLLAQEFYDKEGKKIIDSWGFIKRSISGYVMANIGEAIDHSEKTASMIAAYLVFKNTIETKETKYLDEQEKWQEIRDLINKAIHINSTLASIIASTIASTNEYMEAKNWVKKQIEK